MNEVIAFNQVGKQYAGVSTLTDLSFSVGEGEVLALLGHNGAGKTTSMKLILGLIQPSTGDVQVFGRNPSSAHAEQLRRRLGYLPENVNFYEQLSGREVLAYFARLKRGERSQVRELLERVGLSAAADRRVKTYSKGMRQRLGLAQALLGHPRLLLLDEPTTGLDPAATRDFYAMIQALRDTGCTVILSSHVLPGIEPYIDRALILGGGRCLAVGGIAALREQAGLPLTIRAQGAWPNATVPLAALEQFGAAGSLDGDTLTLRVPQHAKMAVMRHLAGSAEVRDLELQPPTLESLYTHFSQYTREAAA